MELEALEKQIQQLRQQSGGITDGPPRKFIDFRTPAQCREYEPPPGCVLVGDFHVVKGAVFVIGGAPGVGKSRAGVALAVAGATGKPWFGFAVHRPFKTMIIQNENGALRLRSEFAEIHDAPVDDAILISPPPPYGMAFDNPDFCRQVREVMEQFGPDVVIVDPWNSVARDDKAKDYRDSFDALRQVIPAGDNGPALGIIAHTRKPKVDERATGRGLINTLAGSYMLTSVPRAVFVLQPASEEPEDDQVVFTCCKNNDGPLGKPSAWQRRNGLFVPATDFDWKTFNGPKESRVSLQESDLAQVFENGRRKLTIGVAAAELMENTGAGRSACYKALSLTERFGHRLARDGEFLRWLSTSAGKSPD